MTRDTRPPPCLLLLGVHARAVVDVMGWSRTSMTTRYQRITTSLRQDIHAEPACWAISGVPLAMSQVSGFAHRGAVATGSDGVGRSGIEDLLLVWITK